jgi:hypothetical protein
VSFLPSWGKSLANNAEISLNWSGQPVAIKQQGDAAVKANSKNRSIGRPQPG